MHHKGTKDTKSLWTFVSFVAPRGHPVVREHWQRLSYGVTNRSGIGISSKEKLAVGEELSFALRLHRATLPIHIQARVIWTREYGMAGCDYLSIAPVDREILRDWLKAKMQVKKPLISV